MASPLEDEHDSLQEDYYAVLNVPREATQEEIYQAYKQLSRLYHPDKHPQPEKKKKAEDFFIKLKKAYEVLSDEYTRTLYDLYGEKGLETSTGQEVVPRSKTAAEIIAEYERLQEIQEEQKLNRQTNPRSTCILNVDATNVFEPIDPDWDPDDGYTGIPLEFGKMRISQSVECPLTMRNTVMLDCGVTADHGRGVGTLSVNWRRLCQGWSFTIGSTVATAGLIPLTVKVQYNRIKNLMVTLDGGLMARGFTAGLGLSCVFDKHWKGTIHLGTQGAVAILNRDTETYSISLETQLMLKNNHLLVRYIRKFEEKQGNAKLTVKIGEASCYVQYGITKKVTQFSRIETQVTVGIPEGVRLKLALYRGQHTITVPIALSSEILPSSVTYATILPIVVYYVTKKLIVEPFLNDQKDKQIQKKKVEQQEKIKQRKREAEAQIELMQETVERSRETEERKNGLIIVQAVYGKLTAEHEVDLQSEECIDVSIPLQALVSDSKLISYEKNSKSNIPGFYDPCIGEDKKLYILYRFRRQLHHITVGDKEAIRLPQERHKIREHELPPFISESQEQL